MLVSTDNSSGTVIEMATAPAVIGRYFSTFNAHQFGGTAALFEADGQLIPPFESPIAGRDQIANYLRQEASGMVACPSGYQTALMADDLTQVSVTGHVHAITFKVGVEWIFAVTPSEMLQSARIRLMASLKDLLPLRQS